MTNDNQPIIHPIHTSCGDCIFSEIDKSTQTQTGCRFHKIKAYRDKNEENIIEAYDKFNNNFFVVNNHICMHKRTKDWAKDYTKKQWMEMVEAQLKIKYHVIVIMPIDGSSQNLMPTLESLHAQKNPPSLVTIANRSKMAASELAVTIESYFTNRKVLNSAWQPDLSKAKEEWNFQWRLQTFFDDSLHDREVIDFVVDATKSVVSPMFYVVFNCPFHIPPQFSDELQEYFVEEMNHAVFAHPRSDGNGMLVNSIFNKKHAGNCFGINIEDKLLEFEAGIDQYIKQIDEICPSLKM